MPPQVNSSVTPGDPLESAERHLIAATQRVERKAGARGNPYDNETLLDLAYAIHYLRHARGTRRSIIQEGPIN